MAALVGEIMNRELFSISPDDLVADALGYIVALGITGAPVVDDEGMPVGMLSFRDAMGADDQRLVRDEMAAPVLSVRTTSAIGEAGRLMAESGYHRLVVVDGQGRAIGVISALDVVRGLLGMPAPHPDRFPHFDEETGLVWTDDVPLQADRVEIAPAAPGVLVLVRDGVGERDRAVWVEAAPNLRARLLDLVTAPGGASPGLAHVLSQPNLRFCVASTSDVEQARRIADGLLRRAHGPELPLRANAELPHVADDGVRPGPNGLRRKPRS